jgi:hypothetical protein
VVSLELKPTRVSEWPSPRESLLRSSFSQPIGPTQSLSSSSCLISMLFTGVSSPFPGDKENISVLVSHGEKQSRRNALIDGQSASLSTLTLQARLMTLFLCRRDERL